MFKSTKQEPQSPVFPLKFRQITACNGQGLFCLVVTWQLLFNSVADPNKNQFPKFIQHLKNAVSLFNNLIQPYNLFENVYLVYFERNYKADESVELFFLDIVFMSSI